MHLPNIRPRPRTRRAVLAAVVGAALLPSAAEAGTASVNLGVPGGLVSYVAADGETNNVSVFVRAASSRSPMPRRSGRARAARSTPSATPSARSSAPFVTVLLRDRNDTVVYRAPHRASVSGEAGDDVILGGIRQTDTGRTVQPVFYFGNDGRDTISYARCRPRRAGRHRGRPRRRAHRGRPSGRRPRERRPRRREDRSARTSATCCSARRATTTSPAAPATTSWAAAPATTSSSRASSARAAPTRSTAPTATTASATPAARTTST